MTLPLTHSLTLPTLLPTTLPMTRLLYWLLFFLQELQKLFEKVTQRQLLDESGCICVRIAGIFSNSYAPNYNQLVVRAPSWFQSRLLAKDISGKPLMSVTHYSEGVYRKFQEVAPACEDRVKPFLYFLRTIDREAEPLLPQA